MRVKRVDDVHPVEARLLPAFDRAAVTRERGFSARMRREAIDAGITYADGKGGKVMMSYGLLPVVIPAATLRSLARLAGMVERAVRALARRWKDDRALQELLPLWDEERAIFTAAPLGKRLPLAARLDVTLACGEGRTRPRLYEWNGTCVGGLHYSPIEERLVGERILAEIGHGTRIAPQPDLRDLLLARLVAHRGRERGAIAILEDTTDRTGITEYPEIAAHFRRRGENAVHGDLRDLELTRGGKLVVGGEPVAVILRNFELRDLATIEQREGALPAVRAAFAQDRVVSSIAGDLDHKSLWEVLADPRWKSAAPPALRSHLPWTRLVSDRAATLPGGRRGDLLAFVERNRERLVLKPNRSCGGDGVTIGRETSPREWSRTIERALRERREGWVAQELLPFFAKRLPFLPWKGGVSRRRVCVNYGVFATEAGAGVVGRVCAGPVINVSSGGAQMPIYIG